MKKVVWLLLLAVTLAGCGAEEAVFETIGESACEPVSAPEPETISVWVPENASAQTVAQEGGAEIYTWQDYELRVETRTGGDIRATLTALTGQNADALTVMGYEKDGLQLYKTVWSAVGEEGITLGRCLVADDGYYHYCVSLLSPEESESADIYADLCASFTIRAQDAGK